MVLFDTEISLINSGLVINSSKFNRITAVQVSDTTEPDTCTAVCSQKNYFFISA